MHRPGFGNPSPPARVPRSPVHTVRGSTLLLLALAAACGEGAPPKPTQATVPSSHVVPIGEAHVLGRVVDAFGHALPQTRLWVESAAGSCPPITAAAQLDADASFRAVVPAPSLLWISLEANELPPVLLRQRLLAPPGATIDLGTIVLRSHPGLVVQVADSQRRPVADAEVSITPQLLPTELPQHAAMVRCRSATTTAAGTCSLRALDRADYTLSVRAPGHPPWEGAVTVDGGSEPQRFAVVLDPPLSLHGAVSAPLTAGQRVYLQAFDSQAVRQSSTDFSSRFRFDDLLPGDCFVGLDDSGGMRVWFGPFAAGGEVPPLSRVPGEPLVVQVHDRGGLPLAGATVQLRPAAPIAAAAGLLLERLDGSTGPDGTCRFGAVPAGRFDLLVSSDGFLARRLGDVSAGIETMVIVLAPALELAGQVLAAQGQPIAGAAVECVPVDDPAAALVAPRLRQVTDRGGRFRFRSLDAGRYVVRAVAPGCAFCCSVPVPLAEDAPSPPLSLTLQPGAWIQGQLPAGSSLAALPQRPGAPATSAMFGPDGSYQLGPLAAGSHILVYSSPGPEGAAERRTTVGVVAGEHRRIELP